MKITPGALSTVLVVLYCCIFSSASTAVPRESRAAAISFPLSPAAMSRLKTQLAADKRNLQNNARTCRASKNVSKPYCDQDRDGLINARERKLGTDPTKRDTDGDTFPDRMELLKMGSNPLDSLSPSSPKPPVQNGCANEYFDAQGLTTAFEIPSPLKGSILKGQQYQKDRCLVCHTEKGANYTFTQIKSAVTGPLMRFAFVQDADFADLTAYLNRSLASTSCGATPAPGTPSPGLTPTPAGTIPAPSATKTPVPVCENIFFDGTGTTKVNAFGIPSPLRGNIAAGTTVFNATCKSCHATPGVVMAKLGADASFQHLQAAVTGPLMRLTNVTEQQFADLVALMNADLQNTACPTPGATALPTATSAPLLPTPTPSPTPTPYKGACANQYFNEKGETNSFGIPSGLTGSLSAGAAYAATCTSCHAEKGTFWAFYDIKAAVTGPKMNLSLSDQAFADITAWLNRSLAPTSCSGTPTPTPTPLSDTAKGGIVYTTLCMSCHMRASELRGNLGSSATSAILKVKSAIKDVSEMRTLTVSDEQVRTLYVYLRSLP